MDTTPSPSPREARDALERAASIRVTTTKEIRTLRSVLIGVSAAMAAMLLASHAVGDSTHGFWISFVVYAVVLGALLVWHRRTVRSVPHGFGKWYTGGIAVVSLLFAAGIYRVQDGTWAYLGTIAAAMVITGFLFASHIRATEDPR